MKQKILLIGGGGHCKVVIDAILLGKKYKIIGIIDVNEKIGQKILGVPIIGGDSSLGRYFQKGIKNCFIAAGSIGAPSLRIKLYHLVSKIGFEIPNIIHPASLISKFAEFGQGNYVAPGVSINAGAKIGNGCIINTKAAIDHDCVIDDFAHIAPGVTLSGGVHIERCAHIGTGSSIMQGVIVGKNSIIGAGSVVIHDIKDGTVAYGNPCKERRKNA
jgi:sugar O-acyltransferase (sialic acid O-acetyltransferase NeuD family)